MRPDTITVDEIEDEETGPVYDPIALPSWNTEPHTASLLRDCCPGHASAPMYDEDVPVVAVEHHNRPWPEIIDDFMAVEPFSTAALVDATCQNHADWAGRGTIRTAANFAVDNTLWAVVDWLNKQGHTAIARDLQRAGDI